MRVMRRSAAASAKIFLCRDRNGLGEQKDPSIKWAAERSHRLTDAHGRDHVTHAELALDAGGKFLAMRVHDSGMGAPISVHVASCIPTILTQRCSRVSTTPAITQ